MGNGEWGMGNGALGIGHWAWGNWALGISQQLTVNRQPSTNKLPNWVNIQINCDLFFS